MSKDLDYVIKKLETELNNRGLKLPRNKERPIINNYMEEQKEKELLINNQNPQIKSNTNNILNISHINLYIENYLNKYLFELNSNMKKINSRISILEQDLIRKNENINGILGNISLLKNNFDIINKNMNTTQLITNQNIANNEKINKFINEQYTEVNKNIKNIHVDIDKIINKQIILEKNFNENNENNLINEKKIINKINDLYKLKENNINTLSNNLYNN